jgi:hypothetical protein
MHYPLMHAPYMHYSLMHAQDQNPNVWIDLKNFQDSKIGPADLPPATRLPITASIS